MLSDTFDLQSHFAHVGLDSTVTKFLYHDIIIINLLDSKKKSDHSVSVRSENVLTRE